MSTNSRGMRPVVFILVAVVSLFSLNVSATDFAPPPWARAAATATTQEWEFLTDPGAVPGGLTADGSFPPDSGISGFNNPGGAPTATPSDLAAGTIGVGGSATFAWVGSPRGGSIIFNIPNVPDDLPLKHVAVQVEYGQGDTAPFLAQGGFSAVPAAATFSNFSSKDVPNGDPLRDFRLLTFDIQPNPESETFSLFVPQGTKIDQVVIDTISVVPEPEIYALTLVGLAVVGFMARRKQKG